MAAPRQVIAAGRPEDVNGKAAKIVLFDSGAAVIEPKQTKLQRERFDAERAAGIEDRAPGRGSPSLLVGGTEDAGGRHITRLRRTAGARQAIVPSSC
jgi:hypothetical protein